MARYPWNLGPPLPNPRVTQGWGEPRAYRCKKDAAGVCLSIPGHEGLDITARKGTPIHAVADGVVLVADHVPNTISGRNVGVGHTHGLTSSYVHLDVVHVAVGQRVRRGQIVGLSGDSGAEGDDVYRDHLHFTSRILTAEGLELYERAFGRPRGGFGGKTSLGVAVPSEPLIPANYDAYPNRDVIARALARGVAQPRPLADFDPFADEWMLTAGLFALLPAAAILWRS